MKPSPSPIASRLLDEHGVALPLAMIMLMILTALMIAFAVMSKQDPVIAANQLRTSQARAMAESGMERALWALTNSSSSGGLTAPAANVVAGSPYDGTYVSVSALGGFILTVTGSTTSEVTIASVGWAPTNDSSDSRIKAHRKLTATLQKLRDMALDAPCALCVNGDLSITGSTSIDARNSSGTSCGSKKGISTAGTLSIGGSTAVYAADGNSTANEATDYATGQSFSSFVLSTDDMAALRARAKSAGTHYKPSAANGTVTPSSAANGILFIDSYNEGVPSASDTTTVSIGPGAFADATGFHGWIIVNGNADFNGNFGGITGMVYVVGRVTQMTGMGNAGITGFMIVQRYLGGDSSAAGNANITYNCTAAQGDGQVPSSWSLKTGSYREVAD